MIVYHVWLFPQVLMFLFLLCSAQVTVCHCSFQVLYCGQTCQKMHWFTHKRVCKKLQEQREAQEAETAQLSQGISLRRQKREALEQSSLHTSCSICRSETLLGCIGTLYWNCHSRDVPQKPGPDHEYVGHCRSVALSSPGASSQKADCLRSSLDGLLHRCAWRPYRAWQLVLVESSSSLVTGRQKRPEKDPFFQLQPLYV